MSTEQGLKSGSCSVGDHNKCPMSMGQWVCGCSCHLPGRRNPTEPTEADELAAELKAAEARAERLKTVREVFDAGFKAGLSRAGLTSHSDKAYELWLLEGR